LEHYYDVYVGQQAKNWLKNYCGSAPWFCCVSFGGPHEPWDAPEPYASMYAPEAMPKPIARAHETGARARGELDRRIQNAPTLNASDIAALRANYAGNVSLIDAQIGELLTQLKARNEYHNTLVVFCSDHGEMNGDHGLLYKSVFLDSAIRIPLIIKPPEALRGDAEPNTVDSSLVEWIDIGPTLVEFAGGKLHWDQYGKSLFSRLRTESRAQASCEHRNQVLVEFHNEKMLVTKQWKLAVNAENTPYLLFNRLDDPLEQHNRVQDGSLKHLVAELECQLRKTQEDSACVIAWSHH
jgi:arylsulfatase